MKRSEINKALKELEAMCEKHHCYLPPFCHFTPEEWAEKGHDYDEIRDNMLGWDVTDYGEGDFEHLGLALITVRNGNVNNPKYTKAYAEKLIMMGKAYVDELNAEQIREYRGTLTKPGIPSPWRDRPAEESLDLFRRMKAGEFEDGKYVLRAKIDMASPNIVMRDPTIYRIRHASHHRTGDKWCIYPMYDFTHCLSDSIEGITHSICTLEFDNNRELYDWVLDTLDVYRSQQIEFARLNLTYTVLSKRKLIQLVKEGYVRGWDDPRMPTICGLRRRGYTPESIRDFCSRIGIARAADSKVHYSLLEFCCREHLNAVTPRCMAVLDPIKVVITDYPEDKVEEFEQPLHPEDESFGSRKVPFCRALSLQ